MFILLFISVIIMKKWFFRQTALLLPQRLSAERNTSDSDSVGVSTAENGEDINPRALLGIFISIACISFQIGSDRVCSFVMTSFPYCRFHVLGFCFVLLEIIGNVALITLKNVDMEHLYSFVLQALL